MPITFGGINSGLPANLVDQLVEAERMPVKNMQDKKAKVETKLKLVDDMETKINAIRTTIGGLAGTRGFTDLKLNSGDTNIVQGVVDPNSATRGSWNIEVMELAQRAAGVTNGFPDKDKTQIGVGYFRFKTPNGNKDVYINKDNSTLDAAAKAINTAAVGVRASVINDRKDKDAPYRLMISGNDVGDDNSIQYPTLYFLDGDQDLYFDQEREAKNGVVKVDGYEMQIPDNTLKDVIPGITLDLKQAAPGRTVNVSVKEDHEVVSGKVDGFVKAMNEALTFMQGQLKVGEKTDTSKTLGGESMVRMVEQRLRRMLQEQQYGIQGPIKNLNQLGITFNRNGTLNFEPEKFNSILAGNPDAVAEFFAGDGFSTGFISSLRREITTLMNPSYGQIANRKQGFQHQIEDFDKRIETRNRMVDQKEKSLRRQFSNLEEKMSKIKSQGAALGGMSNLNLGGASGGGGLGGGGAG